MTSMLKHICRPAITTVSFLYASVKLRHIEKHVVYNGKNMRFRTLAILMKDGQKSSSRSTIDPQIKREITAISYV